MNENRKTVLIRALAQTFNEPEYLWPPQPSSPNWVKESWAMADAAIMTNICGRPPVG